MRVLIVGGLAESLINFRGDLIRSLIERGVQVHAAAPDLSAESPVGRELGKMGVSIHNVRLSRVGMNPMADLRALIDLFLLARRVRPDCFFGYTIKPVVYGTITAALAGVPRRVAMVTGIGFAMQGRGIRSVLRMLTENLYRLALCCTSEAIFQNPDDHDLFVSRRLAPRSLKTRVVSGSGINLRRFPESALPETPIVFLMIARLLREKGVREYLDAAARIRTLFPSVVFRLVGPSETGPDRFDHKTLQECVDAGVIEYLGPLSDVLPQLQQCTVYVLPSYREGTPRTVLEAMSVGRPIITTDVPGCRQTVVQGVNGFLVPARSIEALVSAMTVLIESPQLRSSMASASRRFAERKYDVDKVNEETIEGILGNEFPRRQSGGRSGGADDAKAMF